MNILDENIVQDQRQLLKSWRISVHQIGYDLRDQGIKDEQILPFLHSLTRPTFFTRDEDFYKRSLCHPRYCLVYLAVDSTNVAVFVRRRLRHPEFDTQRKRMGAVIRASRADLSVWRPRAQEEIHYDWPG